VRRAALAQLGAQRLEIGAPALELRHRGAAALPRLGDELLELGRRRPKRRLQALDIRPPRAIQRSKPRRLLGT